MPNTKNDGTCYIMIRFKIRFMLFLLSALTLFLLLYQQNRLQQGAHSQNGSIYGAAQTISVPKKRSDGCRTVTRRNRYEVLNNAVTASQAFPDADAVTLATHGTADFLGNLAALTERWSGPISVAVYVTGGDLKNAATAIRYSRSCGVAADSIRKVVSFHVFSEAGRSFDCGVFLNVEDDHFCDRFGAVAFRVAGGDYPINVARNVARSNANTRYVLVSDIELIPSADFLAQFSELLQRNVAFLGTLSHKVFVVPIFEVESGTTTPSSKRELVRLVVSRRAVYFHRYSCPNCNRIPFLQEWLRSSTSNITLMSIFRVVKRVKPLQRWEPVFVGTKDDPVYDEEMTWIGYNDKMSQALEMCLLDYDFLILDNAFLVHKPGVKRLNRTEVARRQRIGAPNFRRYKKTQKKLFKQYKYKAKDCE